MTPEIKKIIKNLPQTDGVYIFKDDLENIIYVGKAKNIKKRVFSHFSKKSSAYVDFYDQVKNIETIATPSEKDALLLESKLIKKYQPKYNVQWKDDKSYLSVVFSNDPLPSVKLTHLKKESKNSSGPFPFGKQIKSLFFNLRKIFPYRTCKNPADRPCLYYHLGLCFAHKGLARHYPKIIAGLKAVLNIYSGKKIRVECYDISNTSGKSSVGSMVVFSGKKADKNSYRKFKIKTVKGADDPKSIREIVLRRLSHPEWPLPDLIVIDGGKSQLSQLIDIPLPIIGISKLGRYDGRIRGVFGKSFVRASHLPEEIKSVILMARDEAHRFAIKYHRQKRQKSVFNKNAF